MINWLKQRFPLEQIIRENFTHYLLPKNLNIWYVFGVLLCLILLNQLVTGIWLTMYYIPTAQQAFGSVQQLMRDVPYGWLLRYLHIVGASALFSAMYLHMLRGLLYGSYQAPRELVWLIGIGLYLLLIAEAFFGYLLPWGQLSYWGAQVVTSLFSVLPGGEHLVTWIRGDYAISDVSLRRFFALHVIALPLLIGMLVRWHIVALHHVGANNPEGVDAKQAGIAQVNFHPFYTLKDILAVIVFLIIFLAVVFFTPSMAGLLIDPANSVPANPLQTPPEITPMWYLAPFYAMLRAVPDKTLGVLCLILALASLFLLPWLDVASVRAIKYRHVFAKVLLCLFVLSFVGLSYLGLQSLTPNYILAARICMGIYFGFFILLAVYSRLGKINRS